MNLDVKGSTRGWVLCVPVSKANCAWKRWILWVSKINIWPLNCCWQHHTWCLRTAFPRPAQSGQRCPIRVCSAATRRAASLEPSRFGLRCKRRTCLQTAPDQGKVVCALNWWTSGNVKCGEFQQGVCAGWRMLRALLCGCDVPNGCPWPSCSSFGSPMWYKGARTQCGSDFTVPCADRQRHVRCLLHITCVLHKNPRLSMEVFVCTVYFFVICMYAYNRSGLENKCVRITRDIHVCRLTGVHVCMCVFMALP